MNGIAAVEARIAQIQARFAIPNQAVFAQVLSTQVARGADPGAVAPAGHNHDHGAAPAGAGSAPAPSGSGSGWVRALPADGQRWAASIEQAAKEAGIDPRLLAALVRQESGFNADARSHAGAIGLAQLMPGTAGDLGVNPHDPMQNLRGGARYLRQQLDRFGSTELALAAYNAGPGRVASAGGIPQITETQNYVARVMGYYRELQGA